MASHIGHSRTPVNGRGRGGMVVMKDGNGDNSVEIATGYCHTQHAPVLWLFVTLAFAIPILFHWLSNGEVGLLLMLLFAVPWILLSSCMASLTTQDQGDHLLIHYGPLPLIRKRLRYDEMTEVSQAKSSWIDGWGIHYVPGRGWTYNLWGFDCVRVRLRHRRLQIGTDDPAGLVRHLTQKAELVSQR